MAHTQAEHRPSTVSDLVGGLVIGFVMAVAFMSYVTLVFSGPLATGQMVGLAMIVPGACVLGLVTIWRSTSQTPLGMPDNNVIAVTASVAGLLAADIVARGAASQAVSTVVVALALVSLVTGGALVLLSVVGAGRLVRFMPTQLHVAFQGTAGWYFTTGGLGVALGSADYGDVLGDRMLAAKVATTIAGAILLVVLGRLRRVRLAVPLGIVGLIAAHHAVFALTGMSGTPALAGWFVGFPDQIAFDFALSEPLAHGVDWAVLLDHLPSLGALVLLGLVTVLANFIGQEEMDGRDLDMDRELQVAGKGSLLAGLFGGFAGSVNPENGRMLLDAGGGSRASTLVAVVVAVGLPALVPHLLLQIPVTVLGSVLLSMGLKFAAEWLLSSHRQLSILEWPTIIVVVTVAIVISPTAALLVGLVLGTMGFAIAYARGMPIAVRYRGDVAMSQVERPAPDVAWLTEHARARLVLHLRGYLFFGTAARIEEDVRDEIVRADGALRFVILDFSEVEGIDVSAAATIEALARFGRRKGTIFALSAMPVAVYGRVLGAHRDTMRLTERFATLDQALEWSEERILAQRPAAAAGTDAADGLTAILTGPLGLKPVDIRAGTAVITQGEQSHDLIFVVSGRVGITMRHGRHPPVRVRTFTAGTMVGEIGFFLGSLRTATVVAEEDCRILVVTRDHLDTLRRDHPAEALALMRGIEERLCLRIRDKDHLVNGLLRASRFQR